MAGGSNGEFRRSGNSLLSSWNSLFFFRNSLFLRAGNLALKLRNHWSNAILRGPKSKNLPYFSVLTGNFRVETGLTATASATMQSQRLTGFPSLANLAAERGPF